MNESARSIHPSTTEAVVHPAGRGSHAVWLPWHENGLAAIKTSAADSEGRFSQVEFDDGRGSSPPLHVHPSDETFFVVDGEIELVCDGRRLHASTGDFVLIPRGQAHSYLVTSERARLLVTFAPAGPERVFAAIGIPVVPDQPPPPPVEPDADDLARQAQRYDIETVGPPLTLPE